MEDEDKEIIEANRRAYDNIDKREESIEKKEQVAGKVIDRIKHFKKVIKTNVRAKLAQQVGLARKEAEGEEVDPESRMSQTEVMMMMGEAALIIDSLEQQEMEMQYFQMGVAKRIKCPYCEHKGQSHLEESVPWFAYVICLIVFLAIGYYAILTVPCILGIFQDQRHRCPKCHNEIKEDSIFSSLDDNIVSFNLGSSFGFIVTRRTLIKALIGIAVAGLAMLAWDVASEGPTWYLDGRDADPSLTWDLFVKDCGNFGYHNSKQNAQRAFNSKYKNTVVEWEGKVLRVDGDHEDDDEDPALQISQSSKHYMTHASAEIMIRMDPPLKSWHSTDYDLLLVLDSEHFNRNQEALDLMRVGSDIKFKGFLRALGGESENGNRNQFSKKYQKTTAEDNGGETMMPWFTVFDITVVRQIDELPTDERNRKSHHHLHKDVRYSINKDPIKKQKQEEVIEAAEINEVEIIGSQFSDKS